MINDLRILFAPLLALVTLAMGTSLLSTLIAISIDDLGGSDFLVGLASSFYYLGMTIGAFKIEPFVIRVGHIRAYAVFAALITASSLLHCFWQNTYFWVSLRLLTGFGLAGMYIVIESWLLAQSTPLNRARILAIYMVALYGAQSLGQFLINVGEPLSLYPFILTAVLASLSIIPISITHQKSPVYNEHSVINLRKLFRISPSGVFGCFVSGMILSALYGLLPKALEDFELERVQISYLMATTIAGGMALQYPFGWLADKFNKRTMLMLLSFALALIATFIFLLIHSGIVALYVILFVIGGLGFVLYPVAMSHACDYAEQKDMVSVTGGLLLVYGYGCILGPLLTSLFMMLFGGLGFFYYCAVSAAGLGFFVFWRSNQSPPLPMEAQQHVIVQNTPTTPVSNDLDPRVHKD
jgi:MFS family permease